MNATCGARVPTSAITSAPGGGAHGYRRVTLTTYTELAWNGPYYARLGFRYLADAEIGAEVRAIRAAEAAHGLDRWPRAAMRYDLS